MLRRIRSLPEELRHRIAGFVSRVPLTLRDVDGTFQTTVLSEARGTNTSIPTDPTVAASAVCVAIRTKRFDRARTILDLSDTTQNLSRIVNTAAAFGAFEVIISALKQMIRVYRGSMSQISEAFSSAMQTLSAHGQHEALEFAFEVFPGQLLGPDLFRSRDWCIAIAAAANGHFHCLRASWSPRMFDVQIWKCGFKSGDHRIARFLMSQMDRYEVAAAVTTPESVYVKSVISEYAARHGIDYDSDSNKRLRVIKSLESTFVSPEIFRDTMNEFEAPCDVAYRWINTRMDDYARFVVLSLRYGFVESDQATFDFLMDRFTSGEIHMSHFAAVTWTLCTNAKGRIKCPPELIRFYIDRYRSSSYLRTLVLSFTSAVRSRHYIDAVRARNWDALRLFIDLRRIPPIRFTHSHQYTLAKKHLKAEQIAWLERQCLD